MAVCRNCGKKGLFLRLKEGYCSDCYREIINNSKNEEDEIFQLMYGPDFDGSKRFFRDNIEMVRTIEYEIKSNRTKYEKASSKEEKEKLLNTNVDLYKELEAFCESAGDGGEAYFDKNFRHCSNDENSDFIFVQYEYDELKKLEEKIKKPWY